MNRSVECKLLGALGDDGPERCQLCNAGGFLDCLCHSVQVLQQRSKKHPFHGLAHHVPLLACDGLESSEPLATQSRAMHQCVCVCVCVCEDKQEKESANLRTRLICAGRDAAACPSWTTTCHPHTTVTSHSVCISMSKMIVRVCVVSLRGCAGRTLQKSRLRRGRPPSRTARATPRGRRPPPRRWTGCTRPWRAPLPPP